MLQMMGMVCIIDVFFTETFLFIGMCRFATTFASDLKLNVQQLADEISEGESTPNEQILTRKIIQLIRFQADSKK